MDIQSHDFMANRWGNSGNSGWLYFSGLQNHCRGWLQPWNQKTLTPWKEIYDQPRKVCLVNRMERLEISSRKLEIPREHFMQRWAQKRTEMVWTQQKLKILRRGGKNAQKNCTKKDLHDPDNHDGVITDLEPDILECEVKWALESITMNKASGGDGIPVVLFQILKDDAVKVLHSICQQMWKTQQWPQDWKRSVFIPVPKKGNAKEWLLILL